jgi:hypothetical protein
MYKAVPRQQPQRDPKAARWINDLSRSLQCYKRNTSDAGRSLDGRTLRKHSFDVRDR